MDIVSYILSTTFTKKALQGVGFIKGSPCTIQGIVDNPDGTHDITFSWKDNTDVTHTSVLTVKDGETPAFSSVAITGGNRLTFTTQDPAQSVSFNVMDGAKGDTGISVVASNVDDNNNLTLTLSNGNIISAGKIKVVTTVDNALSTTSSNPVENKVITNALNNKVDKEMGKGLFSDEEKAKLATIEDGAQVNVLEKLIINGQEATITDKSIALTLITSAVSNLQNYYLKTETYTKQEVEDLIGQTVGVTIEIVEQLPAEGQSNVIYFLPTETEGVYSQYIYTTDGWILIGSTTVDLSNYYTKVQVDTLLNGKQNVLTIDSFPTALSNNPVASGGVYTAIAQMQPQFQFANMPTASASNLGFVYQYTGATGTYTQDMFYRCVYDSELGEYKWVEVIFHATVTVDSAISGTSTNPVQNKVIKEALDTKQDIMQYSTMPSAQDNLGKIVQYIGTNTANYTNGYFYKAVYDSTSDVYVWSVIKFSADMLVDNALSTTSENPVQNKVITGAINNIQGVIPSEASSTNQLVDRDSLGTASQKNFTPYVSPDNTDVPISSSVYSAITSAVYGAYHPSGSKTIAELTSDLLILANIGNVYKITEDGVTTDLFIGGAGQTIHTGDNAVVVYGGQPNTFLFDLQSGSIDLTPYQTKELTTPVVGETTVEGALSGLNTKETGDIKNVYEVMGQNGAKNFIPFDLDRIKAKNTTGTWNGNVYSLNGIDFTFNSDGTVDASGTATETASVHYYDPAGLPPFGGDRILRLTGCPSGGGTGTTYKVMAYRAGAVDGSTGTAEDYGDGISLRWLNDGSGVKAFISISVYTGAGTIDLTFKPMLRLASDTDPTYQPYAKTNQELTSDAEALTNQVKDMNNVYGAKNLILYPCNNGSRTNNGITFTDNGDGTVTANGTATADAAYNISQRFGVSGGSFSLKNRNYLLSGCESGSNTTFFIQAGVTKNNVYSLLNKNFDGDTEITVDGDDNSNDSANIAVQIVVRSGQTLTNKVFKPMIRLASIQDDTWVPYVPTNKELMSCKLNGYVGAKNLNSYPYTNTSYVSNGITWTDNGDGTVTANGTATADSYFGCHQRGVNTNNQLIIPNGTYIASGCPDTGSGTTYEIRIERTYNNAVDNLAFVRTMAGKVFTANGDDSFNDHVRLQINLVIRSGATVSNLTFKPMIRRVEDTDPTWQPYAKSNRELTKNVEELSTNATKLVGLSTPVSIFDVLTDRSLYPSSNAYWATAAKLTNGNNTFSSLLSINDNAIVRIDVYSEWYIGIEINDASHWTALIAWANKTTTQLKFIQINTSTSPYVSQVTIDKAP